MLRYAKLALILAFVPGCNLLFGPPPPPAETGSPELKRFESEAELTDYFAAQIRARNASYANFDRSDLEEAPLSGVDSNALADGAAPAPGDAAGGGDGFSGTTTQEVGVDEADVVKTDGTHLYVISSRLNDSVLRIVPVSQPGQLQVLSETSLDGFGRDLYLHDNKVIALTAGGGYFYPLVDVIAIGIESPVGADDAVSSDASDGEAVGGKTGADIGIAPPFIDDEFEYQRPYTLVTVIDVSNPATPTVQSKTKFDGTQSSSRMVDGVLHMVMANYQDYYFDVLPLLGRPELEVSTLDVSTVLPTYERTDADGAVSSGNVVTWQELYRPTDPDGFGVVSLVSIDVDNNASFKAVGVVAEPGLIYSSLNALYLTDTNYDYNGAARTTTDIYKFAYADRAAIATATGTVPGRILNQYSMGEHAGNLRVATTIDPTWFFDETGGGIVTESQNGVYVLGQSESTLSILGRIENIATGETIQSARFLGDRGYVVTFRQVDPFFTLDLADPTNPRLVGELKVPGYSTFIVPMDANHLLTVGQYIPPPEQSGNWGVQLSIFDVTDFANPVQTSNVVIGSGPTTSAYSEALWDPKAFTYFAEEGMVALPISIYEYTFFEGGDGIVVDGGGETVVAQTEEPVKPEVEEVPIGVIEPVVPQGFDGLFVYHASPDGGLVEMGRVSTRFEEAGYWGASFTRGVFVGENVYAVTDLGIHGAAVNDLANPDAELFFGLPYPIEEPPIVVEPVEPDPILEAPVSDDGGTDGSDGSIIVVGEAPLDSSTTDPASVVHNIDE